MLKCWAIISCHPLGIGSGSSLWDFSDLSEGHISWNAAQLPEEAVSDGLASAEFTLELGTTSVLHPDAAAQARRRGSPGSSSRGQAGQWAGVATPTSSREAPLWQNLLGSAGCLLSTILQLGSVGFSTDSRVHKVPFHQSRLPSAYFSLFDS